MVLVCIASPIETLHWQCNDSVCGKGYRNKRTYSVLVMAAHFWAGSLTPDDFADLRIGNNIGH